MTSGSSEGATSYAAALASGSTKSSPPKSESSPSVAASTMTSINGASESVTGNSTPRSAPSASRAKAAGGSSSAPEVSRQSTPANGSVNGSKYDDAAAAAAHEEKSNEWEGNSQASSHPESKSSGADTARSSDFVQQPTVNYWKKRQEEAAKKTPAIPSSISPTPGSKASSPEKSLGKKGGSVDDKIKDEKKGSDEGKPSPATHTMIDSICMEI
jgi:hypothetical protein